MKRLLRQLLPTLFACLLFFSSVHAQENKTDSLKTVLKKAKGTQRVDALNALFNETYRAEPEEADKWVQEASSLADQLGYAKGKINVQLNQARKYYANREYDAVIAIARKTLPQAEKENMPDVQSKFYRLMGNSYRDNNKYAQGIKTNEEYLAFAEKSGNNEYIAYAYGDRGLNAYYMGDLNKAMENFKLSMSYHEKNHDFTNVSGMAMNIGVILFRVGQAKESLEYYDKSLKAFEQLKDTMGIANSLVNQGMSYESLGSQKKARQLFEKGASLYKKINFEPGYCNTMENLGNSYNTSGDYAKALKYHLMALKNREKRDDKRGIAGSYVNISDLYAAMRDTVKAVEYVKMSMKINQEIGNEYSYSNNLMALGNYQRAATDFDEAIKSFRASIAIKQRLGDKVGLSGPYIGLGNTYYTKRNYDSALVFYLEALKITESTSNANSLAGVNANIGTAYKDKGNYREAVKYLLKAREMQQQINDRYNLSITNQVLAEAYAGSGRYKEAYETYRLFHSATDSMFNDNMSKAIAEMQTKYEVDKKQKENQILQQKSALDKAKLERNEATRKKQSIILYAVLGIVVLFVVLLVVMIKSNLQRKKTNVQLREQNQQISTQKHIIEEKNKDITDSINYAKRIQEAILPPDKLIRQYLTESFVVYKPKDIVSGDFYWMDPRGNKILFAVVDCTGHGVPGAFVSIVGHNNLNRAVKEYNLNSPAQILDKLNALVEETFDTHGANLADGMDISLCALDLNTNKLEWAGANNPLWIIGADKSFTEVKADKQPIGKYIDRKPFTNHEIQLNKGDALYIFSDGYADQFGGPQGKKFKYSQLRDILISINTLPMQEQKNQIMHKLEDWRGELEQIDDICIIGLRV